MNIRYYKTDLGIIIKDNDSIRLKSCYKKTIIPIEDFEKSNPVQIKKQEYFRLLNDLFNNDKAGWTYNGCTYQKLDNFKYENDFYKVPSHSVNGEPYKTVLYKGKIYYVYTLIQWNYYPRMQLIDFNTKQLTSKWTDIRNLAPVYNKTSRQII